MENGLQAHGNGSLKNTVSLPRRVSRKAMRRPDSASQSSRPSPLVSLLSCFCLLVLSSLRRPSCVPVDLPTRDVTENDNVF